MKPNDGFQNQGFIRLECICGAILRYKKSQTKKLNSFSSDCENCGPLIISKNHGKGTFKVEKMAKHLNRGREKKLKWNYVDI